jgi:hypothetical protein
VLEVLNIGKAHQRKIRDEKRDTDTGGLFGNPTNVDIKSCELREIDYQTAKRIIEEYEWLGTMGTTQFHYGIYFEGVCAGVVCFGYFQAMNTNSGGHPYAPYVGEKYAQQGIQLSRGACVHWSHEHSGSKLISFGLREMAKKGYKYCVAFSDHEAGEIGTLYQATNWNYLGIGTTKHYDIYYKKEFGGKLYQNDRDFYKEHNATGKQRMEEFIADKNYLELRLRLPKAKYIKLLGNKIENKEMMKVLSKKVQPYPKRGDIVKP